MKTKLLAAALLLFTVQSLHAQMYLKGTVTETGSKEKMPNVFVTDKNNKEAALTEKDGSFEIKTAVGHLLIFNSPGYVSDTLYVINMSPVRIQLAPQGIALREVNITSSRPAFNARAEYPQVYERSKVYVFSPSTWFSKDGKNARRLKHYFAREEQERHVDAVFTRVYVGSLVPLKGEELENFMSMYRPSYQFLISNNSESLASYINDSYVKYKALPPDERKLAKLTTP